MKRFFVIIFILHSSLFTLHSLAQQSLYGTITDTNGKPMAYASLFIPDMNKGIISDESGRYLISNIPAGKHTIHVSFIGYASVSEEVNLSASASTSSLKKDFTLKEETIDLQELMVLPGGMDYPTFLLMQMKKHITPLRKRVKSYDCTTTTILNKRIDLTTLKKKRTIRFALLFFKMAKIFDILMKYPTLDITMSENIHFDGSIHNSPLHVSHISPKVEPDELKSICKKDWFMDKNPYDEFYDIVERNIKDLKKKNHDKIYYRGSYQENGKTILIVEFGNTHVEIVDGIYQIRRARYRNRTRVMQFEFQQVAPNVYLPTSGHAKYFIDWEGYPKGTVNVSMGITYRNVKKR